jgi:hypothetical protein
MRKINTQTLEELKEISARLESRSKETEGDWTAFSAVSARLASTDDKTDDGCECVGHQNLLYFSFVLVILALICFCVARGLAYADVDTSTESV